LTYRLPSDPSREWERTFASEDEARSWVRSNRIVALRLDRIGFHRRGQPTARISCQL
jgi:hypothetical protein